MTNKRWLSPIMLSLVTACTVSTTTPPPSGPPPSGPPPSRPPVTGTPVAVDNGQPKMHAAMDALKRAHHELEVAEKNKGGHRDAAINLVQQAMSEVQAGIDYANAHPTQVGPVTEAGPEPVNEEVVGAANQPHMGQAMVELREARRQLREAKGDKGGHRARALEYIKNAEKQVREGIKFANQH